MYFQYLGMDFSHFVLWFFAYAFFGWVMECIVIKNELGYWENRGFSKSPFCIIYGFGVLMATSLFQPLKEHLIRLFFFSAIAATMLEYLTALIMLKLFGKIWWDYSHLKYNYKGILSLEGTIGWGCIAVFVISFWNDILVGWINYVPNRIAFIISMALALEYIVDFGINLYISLNEDDDDLELELDEDKKELISSSEIDEDEDEEFSEKTK